MIRLRRLIFGAAILLVISSSLAATLTGTVVRVADGDTITVLDSAKNQHKIRLEGIDAPERGQPFGNASREHLAALVAGKPVTIEWEKRDRYRRIVGKVRQGSTDAGLEQIRAGMAWHYKYYAREQAPEDRAAYAAAETEARSKRLGLWVEKATPPWEWRTKSTYRDRNINGQAHCQLNNQGKTLNP